LGYRITERFVANYFGRVFDNPRRVFDDGLLRPETQDAAAFVDGVRQIREAHQRVARACFADGTIEELCPPLQALVTIMAEGTWKGMDETHPEFRRLFTREAMLASDWYAARLDARQQQEIARWEKHVAYLQRRAAH